MPEHTTDPQSVPDETDRLGRIKSLSKAFRVNSDAVKARNKIIAPEALAIRSALRKATQAYKDDLVNKRDAYADEKMRETGEAVIAYVKVNTGTQAGDDAERLRRNRDACSEYQANLSDEKRFKAQQRNWANKQRKKGVSEIDITAGLARRQVDYETKGRPCQYSNVKDFGAF